MSVRLIVTCIVLFALIFGMLALPRGLARIMPSAEAAPTELFFSEYIEGSSNNKALEIYNGTGSAVDLSAGSYNVQMFFNGSTSAGTTVNLTGTVAAGSVFVLAQSSADPTIIAKANQTNGSGWYNGDDAVVLRKGTTIIDSIGQVGVDPGTEWGTGLTSTADNTLRRKSAICTGDATATDAFDPSAQWDGFATDTFDGLGTHSATCGIVSTNPSGVGAAIPSTVTQGDNVLLTVTVTPGTNPASTNLAVSGDLTTIGGSATQQFFDDGTNGDLMPGDNVFSYGTSIQQATTAGVKSLSVTITDAQARLGMASISLTVQQIVVGQALPFGQNWSNTSLITADDDWSGVPGIVGYRGDGLASGTGADPQTVLGEGTQVVDVIANQSNPNTLTSGGVAEFQLSDPVVALQGSGTAKAPNLVISVNTTGQNNITVFYNLRDVDGSADNSVQPVALQYRVGSTGNFTNVPAAFVADASSGPNDDSLVTPVAVVLPSAVNDKLLVQLRIITTDALGSDEWIGVDDIQVVANGTIPLSASGSATPNRVNAETDTLLKVRVNPANNPTSTSIAVQANLSAIGGTSNQTFYDDGTNGDVTAGDNIFSFDATVSLDTFSGNKTLPVSVSDGQGRTASTSISLGVNDARDPATHLVMGNPSNATADVNNPDNYLLAKNEYVVGYNRDRGTPNWVLWHLDSSWLGTAPRQDDFRPDTTLPDGWYQVTQFDYSNSGFDRGHHCPSGDRTATIPENSATFLMTNMMPQAPDNNQGPWEKLESDARDLVTQGNELYIIAGGTGTGGTGSNGGVTQTIANGHVTVPAYTWKVIMVLPNGGDDVNRVTTDTRVFGIIMPNAQGLRDDAWQKYVATVDQVEALTGYDFFSNVPTQIQDVIESRVDPASNVAPTANGQSVNTDEDTAVGITLAASDPNVNNVLTYSVKSGPSHGTISGSNDQLTYTPDLNYNGPDSFEFEVSDGGSTSTATVNISVASVNDAPVLAAIPNQTVNLGSSLVFTVSASDVDLPNDTLTYSLTGTVPAGASIDPTSGIFSWTPTTDQAGNIYPVGVRVTDAGGLHADQTVNIGVAFTWTDIFGSVTNGSAPKAGSSVPIKFKLTGASSTITDAQISLFIAPVINGVVGTESAAVARGSANDGNLFAYDSTTGEYYFIWNTNGLSPGTYQLRIDTGDGVSRTSIITLR